MKRKKLLSINLLGGAHRVKLVFTKASTTRLKGFSVKLTGQGLLLCSLFVITACQNHQDADVQLCDLFESKLDSQLYLSEDDFNNISTKLITPEKKPIPMLSAAKIIMTAAAFKHAIQQSEWERYVEIIAGIHAGDVVATQLFVDLDGDGVLEQIVEFSGGKQTMPSFNYVINFIPVPRAKVIEAGYEDTDDKHRAKFNQKYFVSNEFTPLEFGGQFRVFDNQPYLIQFIKNNKQLTDIKSEPEQRLIIAKPVWMQSETDSQQLLQIKELCQFPIQLDNDKKGNK